MIWGASNLRFVIFAPTVGLNVGQLLHEISGTYPTSVQQNGPIAVATAAVDGHNLTLAFQPHRFEIGVTALVEGFGPPSPFPDFQAAREVAEVYLQKLLNGRVVARVACLVEAQVQTAGQSEALAVLQSQMPNVNFPDGSLDVLFQVNIRTNIDGNEINRLCKWSTAVFQMVQMDIAGQSMAKTIDLQHAAMLAIDINTQPVPDRTYDAASAAKMAASLADQAAVILHGGYDALCKR